MHIFGRCTLHVYVWVGGVGGVSFGFVFHLCRSIRGLFCCLFFFSSQVRYIDLAKVEIDPVCVCAGGGGVPVWVCVGARARDSYHVSPRLATKQTNYYLNDDSDFIQLHTLPH